MTHFHVNTPNDVKQLPTIINNFINPQAQLPQSASTTSLPKSISRLHSNFNPNPPTNNKHKISTQTPQSSIPSSISLPSISHSNSIPSISNTNNINPNININSINPYISIIIHLHPTYLPDIPNIPSLPITRYVIISNSGESNDQDIQINNLSNPSDVTIFPTVTNPNFFKLLPSTVNTLNVTLGDNIKVTIPDNVQNLTLNSRFSENITLSKNLKHLNIINLPENLVLPNIESLTVRNIDNPITLPYINTLKKLELTYYTNIPEEYSKTLTHLKISVIPNTANISNNILDISNYSLLEHLSFDFISKNIQVILPKSLKSLSYPGKIKDFNFTSDKLTQLDSGISELTCLTKTITHYHGIYNQHILEILENLEYLKLLLFPPGSKSRTVHFNFNSNILKGLTHLHLQVLDKYDCGVKAYIDSDLNNIKILVIDAERSCDIYLRNSRLRSLQELYVRDAREISKFPKLILHMENLVLDNLKKCSLPDNTYISKYNMKNLEILYLDILYVDIWDYRRFPRLKKLLVVNVMDTGDTGKEYGKRIIPENLEIILVLNMMNKVRLYEKGCKIRVIINDEWDENSCDGVCKYSIDSQTGMNACMKLVDRVSVDEKILMMYKNLMWEQG